MFAKKNNAPMLPPNSGPNARLIITGIVKKSRTISIYPKLHAHQSLNSNTQWVGKHSIAKDTICSTSFNRTICRNCTYGWHCTVDWWKENFSTDQFLHEGVNLKMGIFFFFFPIVFQSGTRRKWTDLYQSIYCSTDKFWWSIVVGA